MSPKTSAEVVINGKVYTLSGYEEEDYLQKVAAYINNKINEYDALEDYRHLPPQTRGTLIQLNIADDYFKAKSKIGKLEHDLEQKDQELYDLKHDLISHQVRSETAESSVKDLEDQNRELKWSNEQLEKQIRELTRKKEQLEKSLEDALLGGKGQQKGAPSRK